MLFPEQSVLAAFGNDFRERLLPSLQYWCVFYVFFLGRRFYLWSWENRLRCQLPPATLPATVLACTYFWNWAEALQIGRLLSDWRRCRIMFPRLSRHLSKRKKSWVLHLKTFCQHAKSNLDMSRIFSTESWQDGLGEIQMATLTCLGVTCLHNKRGQGQSYSGIMYDYQKSQSKIRFLIVFWAKLLHTDNSLAIAKITVVAYKKFSGLSWICINLVAIKFSESSRNYSQSFYAKCIIQCSGSILCETALQKPHH